VRIDVEAAGRLGRPRPPGHPQTGIGERGGDEVGDEPVRLQPVRELRVGAPVVAAPPPELLPLDAEPGGDEDRSCFVEEPVRLRFAVAERGQRVEAVEHAMAIEEQEPILRPTPRREEQQRQLIRR
jgi:hypothetical protein